METIRIEIEENVARIVLDRPAQRNALNEQMLFELQEACQKLNGNREVRCVIVTGSEEGRAFAAGADIAAMEKMTYEQACAFAQLGCETLRMLEQLEQPVVAAVNGYALGGGMEIALACDIRLAYDTAAFGLPETTLGVMPGFGGTVRLRELVGRGRAAEMIFTGKMISAHEALQYGLINACFEKDVFAQEVAKLAHTLCANAPLGIRNAKKAMTQKKFITENMYFAQLFLTKDQKTGMGDFNRKKKTEYFSGE